MPRIFRPGSGLIRAEASGAQRGARSLVVPPLSLSVRQGRVAYDAVPLTVAGERMSFSGSFDLVTRQLDLATELPLSLLGESVASQLEGGRLGLEPTTRVPLRLSGTPRKPRVTIPREFLEGVLKDAAKDAAKQGLEGLLEKALKKDG